MRPILFSLAAVAALAACSESPTQVADSAPLFARASAGPVVASVTGSGHALCSDDGATCASAEGDDALRTFTVSARLYADGTASGKAQFNNRGRDQAWHADVECVLFRPSQPNQASNQVWMLGTLTSGYGQVDPATQPPAYTAGARVLFAVEDNGQGNGAAAPDRLVGLAPLPEGQYQFFCPQFNAQGDVPLPFDFFMSIFSFDPIRGNIQVRPPAA